MSFEGDKKCPGRVDNEAKAQLDALALSLQQQPDAKAVLVGNATEKERSCRSITRSTQRWKTSPPSAPSTSRNTW